MAHSANPGLSPGTIEHKFFKTFEPKVKVIDPSTHLSLVLNSLNTYPYVQFTLRRFQDGAIGGILGNFTLSSMPGCCGILVSHSTSVSEYFRGRGLGSLMQEMKGWLASQLKISKLIATTLVDNKPETSLLTKFGWRSGEPFVNPRTGNKLVTWERSVS